MWINPRQAQGWAGRRWGPKMWSFSGPDHTARLWITFGKNKPRFQGFFPKSIDWTVLLEPPISGGAKFEQLIDFSTVQGGYPQI